MKKVFCLALVLALTCCAFGYAEEALTFADTIAWDGEYDVVVAGFGGAGAVAARYAADAGASVLVVEKAPKGQEGGNTRFCGQFFMYGNGDEEATYSYIKGLAGEHDLPDDVARVYAAGISRMAEILVEEYGADRESMLDWTPYIGYVSPEYPEVAGSEKIGLWTLNASCFDGAMWNLLRGQVEERSDRIDVWFESPAESLIQDPVSGTILGVEVNRKGENLNIRAKNGVVLATGGFENNAAMIETYLGYTNMAYYGTEYNTGDGIRMAMEVGADMWHMSVYESGGGVGGGYGIETEQGARAVSGLPISGSNILVAEDGTRFLKEDEVARHGHYLIKGEWVNPRFPAKFFYVCDQKVYDTILQNDTLKEIVPEKALSGATIEELAANAGIDAETLRATIEKYNAYAAEGIDPEYGRGAGTMAAFDEGAYYAIPLIPNMLNTQGGPRRNANAEVVDRNGEPIPHLYSAGELGGVTAHYYQGGGNVDECLIFGKIAGTNAAAPKEDTAGMLAKAEEKTVKYIPGAESDLFGNAVEVTAAENEYIGVGKGGIGGDITVKVTMEGDLIQSIEVVDHNETEGYGSRAIESMPAAMIEAQSAQVDMVSGATLTSKALIAAVEDALSQVK